MSRIFLFVALLSIIVLTSCRVEQPPPPPPEPTTYQKIHEVLASLQNFRARATVEYISNKGSNVYETLQHSRITGEYRIEVTGPERVAGNVTSSNGHTIFQFSTRVNGRITVLARETRERSEIFLTSFIRNYMGSQETSVSVANMGEGQFTVLEATIPGNHPYLATQKLWVSNETLLPAKMIIFDPNGTERVIVTYHSFEYNIELDEALFTV